MEEIEKNDKKITWVCHSNDWSKMTSERIENWKKKANQNGLKKKETQADLIELKKIGILKQKRDENVEEVEYEQI